MSTRSLDKTIHVNGAARPWPGDGLEALLAQEGIARPAKGVAVAVNGALVPKSQWETRRLEPGDNVEIVRAMQGG